MKSRCDGEKLIKMCLYNKNLVVLVDLIKDLFVFFRRPFDGTDDPIELISPNFNNYPPMIV